MESDPVFSVSEFIEVINQHLSLLGTVVVEGELSRLDIKNQRLVFATVKDATSSLDVFGLTFQLPNLFQLEAGMLVRVYGTAGLYKQSGRFRLFASQILPQGEGALQIAFDKLKLKLEAEGLFDPTHKRPLPAFPQRIGLITAPNSAAYHDLVKVLSARMGGLTLKLLPVSVQGRDAIPTIITALDYVNHHPAEFDLIILARGGGSLEDLAAFNDETVTRRLYGCSVPTIAAIGHENNWSLCDFVADVRASTPSNAAELTVRDRREFLKDIDSQYQAFYRHLKQTIAFYQDRLPIHLDTVRRQVTHLQTSITTNLHLYRRLFTQYSDRLVREQQLLTHLISTTKLKLDHNFDKLNHNLDGFHQLLTLQNPRRLLAKGYSLTYTRGRQLLRSVHQVQTGDRLQTHLADGTIDSIIS